MEEKKKRQKTPGSGRKKGTPNKRTVFGQQYLMKLLSDYVDSGLMESDLAQLSPQDRIRIVEKYASYLIPKQAAVTTNLNVDAEAKQSIIDRLNQLANDNE